MEISTRTIPTTCHFKSSFSFSIMLGLVFQGLGVRTVRLGWSQYQLPGKDLQGCTQQTGWSDDHLCLSTAASSGTQGQKTKKGGFWVPQGTSKCVSDVMVQMHLPCSAMPTGRAWPPAQRQIYRLCNPVLEEMSPSLVSYSPASWTSETLPELRRKQSLPHKPGDDFPVCFLGRKDGKATFKFLVPIRFRPWEHLATGYQEEEGWEISTVSFW